MFSCNALRHNEMIIVIKYCDYWWVLITIIMQRYSCILTKGFIECVTVNSVLTSYRGECFQTTFKFSVARLELESHHFLHVCFDVLLLEKEGKKTPWDSFCIYYKACKGKTMALDRFKTKRFIDKTTTMSSLKCKVLCVPYTVLHLPHTFPAG